MRTPIWYMAPFSLDTSPQPLLFWNYTDGFASMLLIEEHNTVRTPSFFQKKATTLVLHLEGGASYNHKLQWRCVTFMRRFGSRLNVIHRRILFSIKTRAGV